MKKISSIITLFFILTLVLNAEIQAQTAEKKLKTVVIDAGHGGKDPGAVNGKNYEKDVVLAIALELGDYIKKQYPDVKVIYTRKTDVFIELYKRANIANKAKADLFISIHNNASSKSSPNGFETWVMGTHKNEQNLAVAKKENASVLLEDDYQSKYDGFDPNSPEGHIIFSFFQNLYLDQSLEFAGFVQDEFTNHLKKTNRGVKQAGFAVLYRTSMPSVLIEAGFISNSDDRKYIISKKGKKEIALSIFNAFKKYKSKVEGTDVPKTIAAVLNKYNDVEIASTENKTTSDNNNNNTSNTSDKEETASTTNENVFISVQFAVSKTKTTFKNVPDAKSYYANGYYKYYVGEYKNRNDANKMKNKLKEKGYTQAFIIGIKNEERINLEDAEKLIK